MSNICCSQLIPQAVATITEGATAVIAVSAPTTAPVYSQCYSFTIPAGFTANNGTEAVSITLGGITAPLYDNPRCKRTVPLQMLGCPSCNHVYTVLYGLIGTANAFYAIKGFVPRRTVTPAPAAPATT